MHLFTRLLRASWAFILPYTCILCGAHSNRNQDLCLQCYQELPYLPHACAQCANPLPENTSARWCGACLAHPPPFTMTFALCHYRPPIDSLILRLKFQQALIHARLLGELMAEKITTDWYKDQPLPHHILPIPLHYMRLKERGFNQALELARPIAKRLAIPIKTHWGERHKATAAQASLHTRERQANLHNAFTVHTDLSNAHIAVIDDVMTTGSTMIAFCKALKRAGARRIDVWCCARASINSGASLSRCV